MHANRADRQHFLQLQKEVGNLMELCHLREVDTRRKAGSLREEGSLNGADSL